MGRHEGQQVPKEIPGVGDLQFFKAEDMASFGKLTDGADEESLSVEELKERKIMRILLKVKNGTAPPNEEDSAQIALVGHVEGRCIIKKRVSTPPFVLLCRFPIVN